ncbi:hemerythrin domain-containing protein [Streptomyces thermodiastaticus]|uniref:hemerythrin domain-containing protein n=1 Tax=Streptomyces thermodiastaticus TaxID=44061 RepID=UPI003556732B
MLMSETARRADSREMIAVHDMFRREFSAMPDLAENVTPGDAHHATMVAEHVGFVAGLLHAHHAAEDALLWPILRERAAGDVAPLLGTMQSQHDEIDRRSSPACAVTARPGFSRSRRSATAGRRRSRSASSDSSRPRGGSTTPARSKPVDAACRVVYVGPHPCDGGSVAAGEGPREVSSPSQGLRRFRGVRWSGAWRAACRRRPPPPHHAPLGPAGDMRLSAGSIRMPDAAYGSGPVA